MERAFSRHWALVALAALALAATAGCGGDDENDQGLTTPSAFTNTTPTVPGEPAPTVTTVTAPDGTVTTETIPGTATTPAEIDEIEEEKEEAVADAVFDEKKRAQGRAAEAAASARRDAAARAARAAVFSAGLQVSSVNARAGSVSVTVASSGVCAIGKTRAGRIAPAISRALGGRSASVNVAGSGLPIVQHISQRCVSKPKPRSRFIYQLSSGSLGAGPITTRAFRIRSKSWTIRFTSKGASFKVSLVRGRRVQSPPLVSVVGAATGVKTVSRRGTFKLRVQGPGSWKIVVREAPR